MQVDEDGENTSMHKLTSLFLEAITHTDTRGVSASDEEQDLTKMPSFNCLHV